jgi:hypothetical protein
VTLLTGCASSVTPSHSPASVSGTPATERPTPDSTQRPPTRGDTEAAAVDLQANFPLPPDSGPVNPSQTPMGTLPNEQDYYVSNPSLSEVKAFYESQLPTLGVSWKPAPTAHCSWLTRHCWRGTFRSNSGQNGELVIFLVQPDAAPDFVNIEVGFD